MLYARVFGYYKRFDLIPIWNWVEVLKGEYKYLYKKPIKNFPLIFRHVYLQLFYQYEKVNMKPFDDLLKLSVLRANEALTGQVRWANQANTFEAKLSKAEHVEPPNLNEMTNLIETTLRLNYAIDVHKMSAQRFLSLHDKAIDEIGKKKKNHANI